MWLKKVIIPFTFLLILFFSFCQAEEKKYVIECKITLDAEEYVTSHKEFFIKASIVPEIINKSHIQIKGLQSDEAWNIIDYKVFIYIECDKCGALHLVDVGCTNPNCQGKIN
jgi:hypothetical protein